MVKLRSFQGCLANQAHVPKILSHAYDVVNTQEAAEECKDNEMSFYHVCKPEIDLPHDLDPYDDQVYAKGLENLKAFCEKGFLVEDDVERMYIYQQTLGTHTQQGVLGLASIDDYENNLIKKHELTLPKKEADRTRLVDTHNANAEPVFLTFTHNQEIIKARIHDIITNNAPYGDVTCDDGVRHVLWKCTVEDSAFFQAEFEKIPYTYVADGHHRTAAAFNVGKARK